LKVASPQPDAALSHVQDGLAKIGLEEPMVAPAEDWDTIADECLKTRAPQDDPLATTATTMAPETPCTTLAASALATPCMLAVGEEGTSHQHEEMLIETPQKQEAQVSETLTTSETSQGRPDSGVATTIPESGAGDLVAHEVVEAEETKKIDPQAEKEQRRQERMKPHTSQCSECLAVAQVFQDPTDLKNYCGRCWADYYGAPPNKDGSPCDAPPLRLVRLTLGEVWTDDALREGWARTQLYGWPPQASPATPVSALVASKSQSLEEITAEGKEKWCHVRVRVVPDLVGPHARECSRQDRPYVTEVLAGRYKIISVCGAGHFTRALLATDLSTNSKVCVKRHNNLSVETLTDLCTIGKRLEVVDPEGVSFPRFLDAFFDMSGYTVEALVPGKNCLEIARANSKHFQKISNLQRVAQASLECLVLLARAGVVHADLKPDNIMWTEIPDEEPRIRVVDFGCARLESRIERGRNWSLAEGGAGHLGKWAPEMVLRLPITDRADVWGLAVSLLELYCGGALWSCEQDTVEVVLAQCLGLINARNGLPLSLLRRSPLDITRLYSPAPQHFPIRRIGGDSDAPYEELRPATYGLEELLGPEDCWNVVMQDFADFVRLAMNVDNRERPSAADLVTHSFVVNRKSSKQPPPPPPKEEVTLQKEDALP
jgi:serine/threonine protein kinase